MTVIEALRLLRLVRRMERVPADPKPLWRRPDGCELHATCVTCPLPACVFEWPRGRHEALIEWRHDALAVLEQAGVPRERLIRLSGRGLRAYHRNIATRREREIIMRQDRAPCVYGECRTTTRRFFYCVPCDAAHALCFEHRDAWPEINEAHQLVPVA